MQERLKRLTDVVELTDFLLGDIVPPLPQNLIGKRMSPQDSLLALGRARQVASEVKTFDAESLEPPLRALAQDLGVKAGSLFGILRWAVTGKKVAPPLFGSLAALGRGRTLSRLDASEATLAAHVAGLGPVSEVGA